MVLVGALRVSVQTIAMFYLRRTHTGIERNPLLEKNIYKRQVCFRVPLITGWTVSTEKIKPELLTYRCGRFVRKTGGCAFRVDSPTSYQGVNCLNKMFGMCQANLGKFMLYVN